VKYRKKPVVIEAFQMTLERRMDNGEWPNWLNRAWNGERDEEGTLQRVHRGAPLPDPLEIVTLEGLHGVSWDDWIIRGVEGELYPCKPTIFAATYEVVDEPPPAPEPKCKTCGDRGFYSVPQMYACDHGLSPAATAPE